MTPTTPHPATRFFEAFRSLDVERMLEAFAPGAEYRYVPLGMEGSGLVSEDAHEDWARLIEAFDGFLVDLRSIRIDPEGYAFCEFLCGGRQATEVFGIENRGGEFWLECLAILRANADGLVDELKAYWDQAGFLKQLGAVG